jgi:hypothetical protein
MVNQHGQIPDAALVVEVAKYEIENFDSLKTLDSKSQKFIGSLLKQAYKTKTDKTIGEYFSSINISDEVNRFEAQRQAKESGIINSLTGALKSSTRPRSNSESLTPAVNTKKDKQNRTL